MGGGKEGMNLQGVSLQAEVPLWAQVCDSVAQQKCTILAWINSWQLASALEHGAEL